MGISSHEIWLRIKRMARRQRRGRTLVQRALVCLRGSSREGLQMATDCFHCPFYMGRPFCSAKLVAEVLYAEEGSVARMRGKRGSRICFLGWRSCCERVE